MMRIFIQSKKKTLRFRIPTALLTGKMLQGRIIGDKNDPPLHQTFSRQNMRVLRRALRTYTRQYGHFTLFRLESSDMNIEIII